MRCRTPAQVGQALAALHPGCQLAAGSITHAVLLVATHSARPGQAAHEDLLERLCALAEASSAPRSGLQGPQDLLCNWLELSNPQCKESGRQQEAHGGPGGDCPIRGLPGALLDVSMGRGRGGRGELQWRRVPPQRLLAILAVCQHLSCAHAVPLAAQHLAPVLLEAQSCLQAFSFQQLLHLSCATHQLLGRRGLRAPGQPHPPPAGPASPPTSSRELLPGLEATLLAKQPAQLAAGDALQLLWCASRMCRPCCLLDKVEGPQDTTPLGEPSSAGELPS
jgi:hypothetical protein